MKHPVTKTPKPSDCQYFEFMMREKKKKGNQMLAGWYMDQFLLIFTKQLRTPRQEVR